MTKKIELTKKQLTKLVQFATGKIHSSFTWESEAEDTVDDYLKAINYTHCCKSDSELLTSFAEYLKERDILTTKKENIPVRVDLFLKRG